MNEKTNEVNYTVTQPKTPLNIGVEDSDTKIINFKDSPIEYEYLDRVAPHNADNSINLEYRVKYDHAGSFFI